MWCFEIRHREDVKQLSDIEATIELWISTLWMCVLPLLPFQGSYTFVGFLNMNKPPFSLKPVTQCKTLYFIWQNTKAKVDIYKRPQ